MNKITKEMCIDLLSNYRSSKAWAIAAYVACFILLITKNIIIFLCVIAISLLLSRLIDRMSKKKINNDDFYLVEDELIEFKKRFSPSKYGKKYNYIYNFKDHGKYSFRYSPNTVEISFRKKDQMDRSDVEDFAAESCNTGDRYFLLVCEEKGKGKKKTVTAFPKRNFNVSDEDFDLLNERYYCRKVSRVTKAM